MKFALLIGINYKNTESELNGCINDVMNMKTILINKFGFLDKNIIILTEESHIKPTARNIINQLTNIVLKAVSNPNSQLWIHYSGHGASIQDDNSDEADGLDEVIVPLDFNTKGIITDDQLHNILKYLPRQTKCICFFDCCHSGTILDLRYKYNTNYKEFIDNPRSHIKANIFMISGCKDCQTSADFYNQLNCDWAGAMTTALINSLEKSNYTMSCYHLLYNMKLYLNNSKFLQIPQMTSSIQITKNTIFCSDNIYSLIQTIL